MPEIGMPRAGGDDQVIEPDFRAVIEPDRAFFQIETDRFAEDDLDIFRAVQNTPNRRSNLARREHGGRHLIQQRLKRMMIFAVKQRDFDRFVRQFLRRLKPAETAADNHYSWFVRHKNLRYFIRKLLVKSIS